MKLLVFCTQREKGDLINLFSLGFKGVTVITTTGRDFDFVLKAFEAEPNAVLILTETQATFGFRVSSDTLIMFSRDFPQDALREQAAARNKRVDHA